MQHDRESLRRYAERHYRDHLEALEPAETEPTRPGLPRLAKRFLWISLAGAALAALVLILAPWRWGVPTEGEPATPKAAPAAGTLDQESPATTVRLEHAPWGAPAASRLIQRQAYAMGYDLERRAPQWLLYRLRPGAVAEIRTQLMPDPDLPVDAQPDPEAVPEGYALTQLVWFGHVASLDQASVDQIFYYSTAVPLTPTAATVLHEIQREVEQLEPAWIAIGPMPANAPGDPPSHLFLIAAKASPGAIKPDRVQAYWIPNQPDLQWTRLTEHRATVNYIQEHTGLDFFSSLPATAQRILESSGGGP